MNDRKQINQFCYIVIMKVIERIFERRLGKVVELDEMQMGSMPGRDTTDAIFIM